MRRSSIALSATSHQVLRHLHPGIKRSIRKALDGLATDPYIGKPLKEELAGLWSLPVSHHRIIYQIEKSAICEADYDRTGSSRFRKIIEKVRSCQLKYCFGLLPRNALEVLKEVF